MKNTFGSSVSLTLFGESHGEAIGAVLDGIAPGIPVDEEFIAEQMKLRQSVNALSTARREADKVRIVSGVWNGRTTGTPITFIIENQDTRSKDYGELAYKARPGHADLSAQMKYHGFQDFRGGGHFSGRLTAPLCFAGAVAGQILEKRGIYVPSHLHLNLTYLLEADERDTLRVCEEENSGVRWFSLEEALSAPSEPWMVERIYRKLNAKLPR